MKTSILRSNCRITMIILIRIIHKESKEIHHSHLEEERRRCMRGEEEALDHKRLTTRLTCLKWISVRWNAIAKEGKTTTDHTIQHRWAASSRTAIQLTVDRKGLIHKLILQKISLIELSSKDIFLVLIVVPMKKEII